MPPPALFASASGVKVLTVGVEESDKLWKDHEPLPSIPSFPTRPLSSSHLAPKVADSFIHGLSTGLHFSEDVVREKAFHALPYDHKYFLEALDISPYVRKKPAPPPFHGRYNTRHEHQHMPCHIKSRATHKLKPIKRKIMVRAAQMQKASQMKAKAEEEDTGGSETDRGSFFVTELPDTKETTRSERATTKPSAVSAGDVSGKTLSGGESHENLPSEAGGGSQQSLTGVADDWDNYVLSLMSSNMAHWLVYQKTNDGRLKDKLKVQLKDWYGAPPDTEPELIQDRVSDDEMQEKPPETTGFVKRKWKKPQAKLLERALGVVEKEESYPYQEETGASFYRLPLATRRVLKNQKKEEAGSINTTAFNIEVSQYNPPPPPTMSELFNPAAGKTVYNTENNFQRERLTGSQQMHVPFDDPGRIVMDTTNTYRKEFKDTLPAPPDTWHHLTDAEKRRRRLEQGTQPAVKQVTKGMRRWSELPKVVDENIEDGGVLKPGITREMTQSPDHKQKKRVRNNIALVGIVGEWRRKYQVNSRYADSTPEDLMKDMQDINALVRLKAIATIARAVEYKPPVLVSAGVSIRDDDEVEDTTVIPEYLLVGLECLLEDSAQQVRCMSAITLYALDRPSQKAEEILRAALIDSSADDRWAAAQCLAHHGCCDSQIVTEIIMQLLNCGDAVLHEKCYFLLGQLSINSYLPACMLAEQLNSPSWRHRALACQIIPKLSCPINNDLTQKLCHLMWYDSHSEVRRSSAQALGKTGHGKEVHDQLRTRLMDGDENAKIDALVKIGHLTIMTARLLPAFLVCFEDEYVRVRIQACRTCFMLRICDQQVVHRLLHLASFDPVWKVKATAIQALSYTGQVDDLVRNTLLWSLRYESATGVRAEACRAMSNLNITDPEAQQILQDRLLVEPDPTVRREIEVTLEKLGVSLTEEMSMVADIKDQVRVLCTKKNISGKIYEQEQAAQLEFQVNRLIYKPPTPPPEEGEEEQTQRDAPEPPRVLYTIPGSTPASSSRPSSSRESGAFTPTADQELTDILDRSAAGTPRSRTSRPRSSPPAHPHSSRPSTGDARGGSARARTVSLASVATPTRRPSIGSEGVVPPLPLSSPSTPDSLVEEEAAGLEDAVTLSLTQRSGPEAMTKDDVLARYDFPTPQGIDLAPPEPKVPTPPAPKPPTPRREPPPEVSEPLANIQEGESEDEIEEIEEEARGYVLSEPELPDVKDESDKETEEQQFREATIQYEVEQKDLVEEICEKSICQPSEEPETVLAMPVEALERVEEPDVLFESAMVAPEMTYVMQQGSGDGVDEKKEEPEGDAEVASDGTGVKEQDCGDGVDDVKKEEEVVGSAGTGETFFITQEDEEGAGDKA